jgi:hypothetical protein
MAGKGKQFTKGDARAGRPKGTPNKLTADVKAAIIEAFERAGGASYLLKIAESDPRTFCALLGKVLPMQVTGEDGRPLIIEIVKFAETHSRACAVQE